MKGKQYNYWTNMSCNNHSATTIYFGRQASLVKWIECTLLILIDVLGSNPTADAKRVPLMLGLTLTSDILKDRGWFIDKTTGEFRPLTSGPYDMWWWNGMWKFIGVVGGIGGQKKCTKSKLFSWLSKVFIPLRTHLLNRWWLPQHSHFLECISTLRTNFSLSG